MIGGIIIKSDFKKLLSFMLAIVMFAMCFNNVLLATTINIDDDEDAKILDNTDDIPSDTVLSDEGIIIEDIKYGSNSADESALTEGDIMPMADENTFIVNDSDELKTALDTINGADSGDFNIYINNDFLCPYKIAFSKNTTTIHSVGNHTISFNEDTEDRGISVIGSDTILNLGAEGETNNIIFQGTKMVNMPGFLYVESGGTCNMYDGITITGNVSSNYFGGGAYLLNGNFNMYGGTIEKCGINGENVCYGGGVAALYNSTFTMNGGEIKDCFVKSTLKNSWQLPYVAGGGVLVYEKSKFIMNGGTISGCYAESPDASGGAVAIINGRKSVNNNKAYGYLDSYFEMNDGTITGGKATIGGGGIAVFGTYLPAQAIGYFNPTTIDIASPGINIKGGTISNCEADYGGGIFLHWIRPSVLLNIKNTTIENNKAGNGGGISIFSYWTSATIENCTITGNYAEEGAGIDLISNSQSDGTKLIGGNISNNVAESSETAAGGGGIKYDENSVLYISGTLTIQGNTYNNKPNKLNVLSEDYPVYINGSLAGSQIGITDPTLWTYSDSKSADATALNKLTMGYNENNPTKPNNNPIQYFTSDHEYWYAEYGVNYAETESGNDYSDEVRLTRTFYILHYNDEVTPDYSDCYVPTSVQALPTPTRDGYAFMGWYDNEELTGDAITQTPNTNMGEVHYYAKWSENILNYVIKYNFASRLKNEQQWQEVGTIAAEYSDVVKTGDNYSLANSFILSKAPYESNFMKNLTWDESTITQTYDAVTKTITAEIKDSQVTKTVTATINTPNQGSLTITTNYGEHFYIAEDTYVEVPLENNGQPFSYWAIYVSNDGVKGDFVCKAYSNKFNYIGYDNYVVDAVYGQGVNTDIYTLSDANTTVHFLEYSRNQWNVEKDAGVHDRLFSDIALAYEYKGILFNDVENLPADTTIKVGYAMVVGGTGDYTVDKDSMISAISANAKDTTDSVKGSVSVGEVSKTAYINSIDLKELDNKNRIESYYCIENTEANRTYNIQIYSYIIVNGVVTVSDNPITVNYNNVGSL